uniref:Uncharacterized protein n=1 Tax=Lotus japonicus TaxID=34305 RepID=I3T1E2_LOTJA|nr:unknown [Lotus japonicus]
MCKVHRFAGSTLIGKGCYHSSSNGIDIFQATHNLMSDEVTVVPDNKLRLS